MTGPWPAGSFFGLLMIFIKNKIKNSFMSYSNLTSNRAIIGNASTMNKKKFSNKFHPLFLLVHITYKNQRRPNICYILFSFENDILIKIYECQFSGARYFIFYECHFLSTPRVKYCVYYYCRHS